MLSLEKLYQQDQADNLLLGAVWRQYLLAVVCILALLGLASAFAQWHQLEIVKNIKSQTLAIQREIDNYSRSSQLHKIYLERTKSIKLSEAIQQADNYIDQTGGKLIRIEQVKPDEKSFKLEASMESDKIIWWVGSMVHNHTVLLESFSIKAVGESRLIRLTHRVK